MTATTTLTKADLAAEVAELRAELAALRQELATEVRTKRVVVDVNGSVTEIIAGGISLERRRSATELGSYVSIGATSDAAEIEVGAVLDVHREANLKSVLYAGNEDRDDGQVYLDVGEIRTRRLAVVDEHGGERITTTCTENMTSLDVRFENREVTFGGQPAYATAALSASNGAGTRADGRGLEIAVAEVVLDCGDGASSSLSQRSADDDCGGYVNDLAELQLAHQRSKWSDDGETACSVEQSMIVVDSNGITEQAGYGQVLAHAPMHRVPRFTL